jgi:hypothetical protein
MWLSAARTNTRDQSPKTDYPASVDGPFRTPQIIRTPNHCYVEQAAAYSASFYKNAQWEMTMRKTILSMIGASVFAAATAQMAEASDRHHTRMTDRIATEQFRQSNANAVPAYIAAQPDYRSYNAGMSAPAGR